MFSVPEKFKDIYACLSSISPTFQRILPVKNGIFDEIISNPHFIEMKFSTQKLRSYLRFHTNHELYLRNLLIKNARYNLGGHIDGEISNEQRRLAKSKLRKILKQKEARQNASPSKPSVDKMGRPILSINKNGKMNKNNTALKRNAA